jgi:transcription elongation factor Elf1
MRRRLLRRPTTPRDTGLSNCVACGRDFVSPIEWEPEGKDRWWMYIRCGECGVSREVTVSNAVAERYDDELARGAKAISRAAKRLDQARMKDDAGAFIAALRHGLIEPADFAR